MADVPMPHIKYINIDIKDIEVEEIRDGNKSTPVKIRIKGSEYNPSQRFWDSICSKYCISTSIFNYFPYSEVFSKISRTHNQSSIRVMAQLTPSSCEDESIFSPTLFGVSSIGKPMIDLNGLAWALERNDTIDVRYYDGVILSRHKPRTEMAFNIDKDDELRSRFILETPIDGYGKPNIYLSFYRKIEGLVIIAFNKNYQSSINLGDDGSQKETIDRVIKSFNNEDGFVALRDRLLKSNNSWASVNEALNLANHITALSNDDFSKTFWKNEPRTSRQTAKTDVLHTLMYDTGDIRAIYNVAQINSISLKKRRTLPTKATVWNLIRLANIFAAHYLTNAASRKMHNYISNLLSTDYDLEDSKDQFKTFGDFLVTNQ